MRPLTDEEHEQFREQMRETNQEIEEFLASLGDARGVDEGTTDE